MRLLVGLLVMCGVLAASAPAVDAQMSAAGLGTSGLAYKEDTIFTIGDGSVDVVTTAVMTNTTTEERLGNTIYYSYFDSLIIVVPTDAINLTITSRGRSLSSSASDVDEDFEVRTARLPTELRSGQSRSFTITYTLPKGEIRGDSLFFSNPAFHAFPMWSFSDPGTGSLLLRVPEDAEMSEFGDVLRRTGLNDGYIEWTPRNFAVPENVFTYVTVTIDDALESELFTVAGQNIELRSWPGDVRWASFARESISAGLPALEDVIGLPIPDQSNLEVTESVAPYFYGYGGWYDQLETSIEVGNELDQTVMIHELSHAWFNNGLFAERWVSEGLAEEFTWQVQNELGWESEDPPRRPNTSRPNAGPLVEWGRTLAAGIDDADFREREEYGYNTSWFVVREMVGIIGLENMRGVLAAADADATAYVGSNPEETTTARGDWRRLLDLASVGTSKDEQAKLDELFIDFVISERDIDRLAERAKARDLYSDFSGDELAWRIPNDIRTSMEFWRFDEAEELMAEASDVLDRYTVVHAAAMSNDLELSDAAQISYERNAPDFELALGVLEEQTELIDRVNEVRTIANAERSTEERWGLRGLSLAPYVGQAEKAFAVDDVVKIDRTQASLNSLLARAAIVGADRILWTKIASLAVSAILLLGLRQLLVRPKAKEQPLAGLSAGSDNGDEVAKSEELGGGETQAHAEHADDDQESLIAL